MQEREVKISEYLKQLDTNKLGLSSFNSIKIEELTRGGYNVNYLVDIDNHKFVFRFNLDSYLDVENQIEYESEILRHLEKFNIAPKVFFVDTSKTFFDCDLLVEEFIESREFQINNVFLQDLGRLIKKLHSIPLPQGGLLIKNSDPLVDQLNFIKRKLDFIQSGHTNQKFVDFIDPYISNADAYVSKFSNQFGSENICLNHRDLVTENVLQTDKGLKLIDWQAAMADDPSYDLAFFTCDIVGEWNLGRALTNKEKEVFLNSYQADQEMLTKIHIRQPVLYLELFVWIAYRIAYLQDKVDRGMVEEADKDFTKKRIAIYSDLLDENKMKEYLINFL